MSKINAIRAMYPLSSKIENNKNKIKICGIKLNTENIPANTPSQIKLETHKGEVDSQPLTISPK